MKIILTNMKVELSTEIKTKLVCFGHSVFVATGEEPAATLIKKFNADMIIGSDAEVLKDIKNAFPQVSDFLVEAGETSAMILEAVLDQILDVIMKKVIPMNLEAVEKVHIQKVLTFSSTYEEAADSLGINMSTLWRKRKQYGLDA